MKTFIILTLVALASAEWKPKSREELLKLQDECRENLKVPKELIDKSKNDKYPSKEAFEVSLCVFRQLGIWNDSDGFSVERITRSIENNSQIKNPNYNNKLRNIIVGCNDKNTEGSSPFDWAYRCFKCFIDEEDNLVTW